MNIFFIINPAAGKGISPDDIEKMSNYFHKAIGSFNYILTKNKSDIAAQTRKALKKGSKFIVAVGGDGTIQQVVNGFFDNGEPINPDAVLMISKMGSGSDYYKSITKNQDISWEDIICNHHIKSVDIGEIIDLDTNIKEFFVNMTSAGLSANIVEKKAYMPKWLPGKLKYLIPTLQGLLNYKTEQIELNTSNESINTEILSLFVNKGTFAGGGMKFANSTTLDDGMFEITLVKKMSPYRLATNIRKLYDGKLDQIEEISKIKTSKLRLSSKSGIKLEMDGEYIGSKNLEISVRPQAIKVCFPAL